MSNTLKLKVINYEHNTCQYQYLCVIFQYHSSSMIVVKDVIELVNLAQGIMSLCICLIKTLTLKHVSNKIMSLFLNVLCLL